MSDEVMQEFDDASYPFPSVQKPFLPEFSGKNYEDPVSYLVRCNEYIVAHEIPQGQRTWTIAKGLKEGAATWWQSYGLTQVDWPLFQKIIRKVFDNQIIRNTLVTDLYTEHQEEDEATGPFLLQKYMLFQRVRPDESEPRIVRTLVHLLKPSLKEIVCRYEIVKFSVLLYVALEAEAEVAKKAKAAAAALTTALTNRQPASSNMREDEDSNEYLAFLDSEEFQNAAPLDAISTLLKLQRSCNDARITNVWTTYADMIKELIDNGDSSSLRFLKRNVSCLARFEAALEGIRIGREHSLF